MKKLYPELKFAPGRAGSPITIIVGEEASIEGLLENAAMWKSQLRADDFSRIGRVPTIRRGKEVASGEGILVFWD